MNCDELLEERFVDDSVVESTNLMQKKERLYALAACGKTRQYLGTEVTIEQIQQMSSENIEKLYCRYEAQLGSRMVKSIGRTVLDLYTKVIGRFFVVDSEQDFMHDLTQDPVITKSLETLGCELYYQVGTLLAPVIAGLITFNHINFYDLKNDRSRSEDDRSRSEEDDQSGSCPTTYSTSYASDKTEAPR